MMTASVGEVVAQLSDVVKGLCAAAATVLRAQADADRARDAFQAAGTGTSHSRIGQAIDAGQTASDKAGKVARLLMEAVDHLNNYSDHIAPGSVSTPPALETPSGEQLLTDTVRRTEARKGVSGFLQRATRNVDKVQDTTKSITELGEHGFKIFRGPSRPPSSQSSGSPATPTVAQPDARPKIDTADDVSHFVVAALVVGVSIQRTDRLIRLGLARLRKRGRSE